MNQESEAENIIRELAKNAALVKLRIREGNLQEAARLTGERVALVKALGELRDAKVSLADSDVIEEMTMLLKSGENDIQEAAGAIRTRLSALLEELGKTKGARKIVAYAAMRNNARQVPTSGERSKTQGGRRGY
ncbi:MAG: hypothetical protein M1378_14090 [Bacteroidetes bacterium]|nr:hypothetical protein [Bacteroidota bacterium]